jgi:hypothetical protein
MREPVDHGKGIDAYYEGKRQDMKREHEKLTKMIADGASPQEIEKQRERVLDAGYTGD